MIAGKKWMIKKRKKKKIGFWIGSAYPIWMGIDAFCSYDEFVYKSSNLVSFGSVDQKISESKHDV